MVDETGKGLPVTNTLAYLALSSVMKWKKSFITLTPGINVVKLFYSSLLTAEPNKLECLLLAFFSG
jgi:hypothetical protein